MPSSIRNALGVTEKFRGKPKFSEVRGKLMIKQLFLNVRCMPTIVLWDLLYLTAA